MKEREQQGPGKTDKELEKEARRLKEFGMTKEKAEQFVAEFWQIIEECVLEEENILNLDHLEGSSLP